MIRALNSTRLAELACHRRHTPFDLGMMCDGVEWPVPLILKAVRNDTCVSRQALAAGSDGPTMMGGIRHSVVPASHREYPCGPGGVNEIPPHTIRCIPSDS